MGQLSQNIMKNLVVLTLASLCLLMPMVQAFFFGPIAVALGVGLLAASGGFLVGTALSRNRSRRVTGDLAATNTSPTTTTAPDTTSTRHSPSRTTTMPPPHTRDTVARGQQTKWTSWRSCAGSREI